MEVGFLVLIVVAAVVVVCWMLSTALIIALSRNVRPKPLKSLKDRHVIVTGGSSGLGLNAVKWLLKKGAKVTIIARNEQRLEEARHLCISETKVNENMLQIESCDLGKSQRQTTASFQKVCKAFGPVYMVIASAGYSRPETVVDMPDNSMSDHIEANMLTVVYATKAALPIMMDAKQGGQIVFVSSAAGQIGIYGLAGYSATKFGLHGFAQGLQMEVAAAGILISVFYPTDMTTPGYYAEDTTKPLITRKICEDSGGQPADPEKCAAVMMKQVMKGKFTCRMSGAAGFLGAVLASGLDPPSGVFDLLIFYHFSGLLRLCALFLIRKCYKISKTPTK